MKFVFSFGVVSLLVASVPAPILAQSGGLDVQECHAESQHHDCDRDQSTHNSTSQPINGTDDKNCTDFSTWCEARKFYKNAGPGDPHRLDADNDGMACEMLRQNQNNIAEDCTVTSSGESSVNH